MLVLFNVGIMLGMFNFGYCVTTWHMLQTPF